MHMSYEYIICKSNVEQYTKLLIECNPIGYARTRKLGKKFGKMLTGYVCVIDHWICFFLLFFCISKFRCVVNGILLSLKKNLVKENHESRLRICLGF